MTASNIFSGLPPELEEELIEKLAGNARVRIERIVSHGHASPEGFWYDQGEHEFVILLSGAARLRFDPSGEEVQLRPGDWLEIPAGRRHRVEWTEPGRDSVWLAVHYGPGGDEGPRP